MLKSNKAVAICFFVLSVFTYYGSTLIPEAIYSEGAAGPRLFPQLWSIFIAFLSIMLYGQSYLKEKKNKDDASKKEKSTRREEKNVFFMLIAAIGYIVLMKPLGFVISTFLFSLATIGLLGGENIKNKYSVVLISAIATIVTYVLFAQVLDVFLPTGIFM